MSISQVAEKIEAEDKAQIYQAIGVVTGVLDISNIEKPTLSIEEQIYPVVVTPRALWQHQSGEAKSFMAHPKIMSAKLGFNLLSVRSRPPETHVFTLKGCWEEKENH